MLLRILDVARLLSLSKSAVRNLIKRRELPSLKIGGAVRVDEEDLKTYLESKRERGTDPARPKPRRPQLRHIKVR